MKEKERISNMFIGFTLGDALGVPFEFKSRTTMAKNPATDMEGFGTYGQPKGTWSDDSSLALCLADCLCNGYDLIEIAQSFVDWSQSKKWTARGLVFDIGWHTRYSLNRLNNLLTKREREDITLLKFETDEETNGNGSLMRILPLLYYIKGKETDKQFSVIRDVSALTHGHIRAAIACLIYLKFAEYLTEGCDIKEAYARMKSDMKSFFIRNEISQKETSKFERIIENDISTLTESQVSSSGYVLHTLEASLWCLLNSKSYNQAVFKAINLGDDTDTTATVVGGIAGYYFGLKNVPKDWLAELARREEILELSENYANKFLK